MTDNPNLNPNSDPNPDPNLDPNEPSDAAKTALKGLVAEALDEWAEKHKAAPTRTNRPKNFLNDILGYGKE